MKSLGAFLLFLSVFGCNDFFNKKGSGDKGIIKTVDTDSGEDSGSTDKSDSFVKSVDDVYMIPVELSFFKKLPPDKKVEIYKQILKSDRTDGIKSNNINSESSVVFLIDQILKNSNGIRGEIIRKIRKYDTRLKIHGGLYNVFTGEKILPSFIPGEFGAATQIALSNGADINLDSVIDAGDDANNLQQLEFFINSIRPLIFDKNFKDKGDSDSNAGSDSDSDISDSDVNKEVPVKKYVENVHLNNSTLRDSAYIDNPDFAGFITTILENKNAIDDDVRTVGDRRSALSMFDNKTAKAVEIIDDQRHGTALAGRGNLLGMGLYFIDAEGMRCYPENINSAFITYSGQKIISDFYGDNVRADRALKRRVQVEFAYHFLKQTFGGGKDGTEKKDHDWLKNRLQKNFELIEHLRGDLTALYLAKNTTVASSGLIPDNDTLSAFYDEYVLSVVRLVASGSDVQNDRELMAKLVVLNYLMNAGVVDSVYKKPGKMTLEVKDYNQFYKEIKTLLAEVRKIRFTGSSQGADEIVQKYGHLQAGWSDTLQNRFKSSGYFAFFAAVYPPMTPVRKDGAIVDIEVSDQL
ncbi:MAG: hypothetical protein JXR91_13770 [Deltaproteobacteria bacterium]|nr:hypothetical protein [Deltaproteobacteria bacterium]